MVQMCGEPDMKQSVMSPAECSKDEKWVQWNDVIVQYNGHIQMAIEILSDYWL
jgi:hypothetical protein